MSLFQIRTLANRMKSRANKRSFNSRAVFLSRTLVATILAVSFLTSVAPLVRSAAFHPCKMACCVGKQTHAEGSCSSGLVASRSKPRLRVEGEIFCGLKTAREGHTSLGGFQLSYIFSYGSPLPFNIQTGTDRNFDTNLNDRPLGVARNSGRGFDFASLDLRLSRRFRLTEKVQLETLVEGFNVLNRANLQLPNNVFGTGATPLPSFGKATAASDPRQIQFGLRLSF